MLQEDDGLTFAALDGARYRTTFEVTRSGDRMTLQAEVEGDGYPEFAREAFHLVVHGADPQTVRLDGTTIPRTDGFFRLANRGTGFTVAMGV